MFYLLNICQTEMLFGFRHTLRFTILLIIISDFSYATLCTSTNSFLESLKYFSGSPKAFKAIKQKNLPHYDSTPPQLFVAGVEYVTAHPPDPASTVATQDIVSCLVSLQLSSPFALRKPPLPRGQQSRLFPQLLHVRSSSEDAPPW